MGRASQDSKGVTESRLALVGLDDTLSAVWEIAARAQYREVAMTDLFDYNVAVADDVLCVGRGSRLLGLDLSTGKTRWVANLLPVGGPVDFGKWDPMIAQGRVIINVGNGTTAAFDVASGQLVWALPSAGPRAIWGDRIYMITGGGDYLVVELGGGIVLRAGVMEAIKEKWRLSRVRFTTGLAISETHAFFGDASGRLFAVERDTGLPVWSDRPQNTTGFLGQTPVLASGRLYMPTFSMDPERPPRLLCYEQG